MFLCVKCKKSFKFNWCLQRHYGNTLDCTKEKPFSCNSCQKKFTNKSNCTRHLKNCQNKYEECPLCNLKVEDIKMHINTCDGNLKF